MNQTNQPNPLGVLPEKDLLRQFAIPSIIAMLVSSLYNIVDQFFIGQAVGELGNAATNIVFPLSTSCIAIALLFGIGGSSTFNLAMGREENEKAPYYIGNSISAMMGLGIILAILVLLFTNPILRFFGSPDNVLSYASTYATITAIGFPFLIVSAGGGHLIRADGSPKMTMAINLVGAIVNTVLDAIFVFVLNMGMAGAALATIIGQVIAAGLVFWYLPRCKTVKLEWKHFMPQMSIISSIVSLGMAPCFNQLAMMITQIIMNKSLKYYGSQSIYGESIPIAVVGIVMKVSMLVMAFVIGLSQACQPLASYNYGARKYDRVKKSYLLAIRSGAIVTTISFVLFQLFPVQIISVFGSGSDLYVAFAVKYFRIFLFFIFLCFLQPITSNFFTAIGKPKKGIFLSLTRQIIFFLPVVLILPTFMGIDGITYAGPIADGTSALVCACMIIHELRKPEYQMSNEGAEA